jgi:hypothetical protein
MVLHVSDGKRVHQALVDPKSIVSYYVVWDRNASPGRDFSSGRLNMFFGLSRPSFSSDPSSETWSTMREYLTRLSRARRVVENAFGILAHKFRVLLRTMNQKPETCRKIIITCEILHNLIRLRYRATHNNLMDLEDHNQKELCIYHSLGKFSC